MSLRQFFNVRKPIALGIMPLILQFTVGMSEAVWADELEQKSADAVDDIVSETFDTESSESIEEIIVYGEKSFRELRREVYTAEENFFNLFNSLNQDFEYDVNCFYEAPTGTRLRHHVCRANFVVEATSVQYVEWRTRGPRYPTLPPELVIAKKKKILRQKMETLIAEHLELRQALNEYTDRKVALESAREK